MIKKLKVLISAYACEPGQGSEPGVGWNFAQEISKYHEVCVLTRANNRISIESALKGQETSHLKFIYYDLSPVLRFWKKGNRGARLYYYMWQIGIFLIARRLHKKINFDIVHHVTFVKYSVPSFLSFLPVPFIWGPVGGGETTPKSFWYDLSLFGKVYEILREIGQWIGEHDPFVRLTVKRSSLCLGTTIDTVLRLRRLGSKEHKILSQCGLPLTEIEEFGSLQPPLKNCFRIVSIGRILHWKGFHLGLRAFSKANIQKSEYWIIGEGPELKRLLSLTRQLGLNNKVRFWGPLPRKETITRLAQCDVLAHPSLHDSGGGVCLEAMATGKPVICLNLGGPAAQVTSETGFKIEAHHPEQVVEDMASAMMRLATNPSLLEKMGKAGKERVAHQYSWEQKGEFLNKFYAQVIGEI